MSDVLTIKVVVNHLYVGPGKVRSSYDVVLANLLQYTNIIWLLFLNSIYF